MKKGFLKKLGTIVLGAFMAVSTIGFTVGLTACNFDDDNDHEIVTPVPDPEPDDPIIDPDDPSIEDPDDGKEDPDDGKDDPDIPPIEEPEDPDKEDPDDGKEDPDNPPIEEPEEPVNPPETDKPSREELIEAFDSIYGYTVSASGDDFIRDENGEPIKTFKSDEVHATVIKIFKDKPLAEGSANSCYQALYGTYSSVEDIFMNYNEIDKVYTIASLCEYANPRTENDKTLKVVEIPMDLSTNSFSDLETDLRGMSFGKITTNSYDYKVSYLDTAEEYFVENKEYLDACVEIAVEQSSMPQLILFEQEFVSNGTDMSGSYHTTPMHIVSLNGNEIQVVSKDIHSSSQMGDGWKQNIIDKNEDYVVIDIENKKTIATITREDYLDYNENIVDELRQKNVKETTLSL